MLLFVSIICRIMLNIDTGRKPSIGSAVLMKHVYNVLIGCQGLRYQ